MEYLEPFDAKPTLSNDPFSQLQPLYLVHLDYLFGCFYGKGIFFLKYRVIFPVYQFAHFT